MDGLATRIFDTMEDKEITMQQLANALKIEENEIENWKREECKPPINYITKLSNTLGVSIDYLITGNIEPLKYKLESTEQLLIRLFRTASEKDKHEIFNLAIALNDEHYHDEIDHGELLKTLI